MIKTTKPYILVLICAVLIVTWALVGGMRPVSGDRAPVRVTIAKGASAGEVARLLGENGLIRSPFVFRLVCKYTGQGAKLKPGVYELNRAMSVQVIIQHLASGDSMECWLTVPEGFTAKQIADVLDAKRLASGQEFTNVAIDGSGDFRAYKFVDGDNLEGYLFPDTYLVSRDEDTKSIVKKMLDTFEKRVVSSCRAEIEKVNKERFGLGRGQYAEGLHRVLTVASLVEREAKTPKDRPLVAAVIWNRLAKNMRLEVDATVSYRPGESTNNKDRTLYKDLVVDSPYNTYRHAGLPPAPICNPGLASIKAALNPAAADYLFYVARPDGSHFFTRTYAEHLRAKKTIRNGGG